MRNTEKLHPIIKGTFLCYKGIPQTEVCPLTNDRDIPLLSEPFFPAEVCPLSLFRCVPFPLYIFQQPLLHNARLTGIHK